MIESLLSLKDVLPYFLVQVLATYAALSFFLGSNIRGLIDAYCELKHKDCKDSSKRLCTNWLTLLVTVLFLALIAVGYLFK